MAQRPMRREPMSTKDPKADVDKKLARLKGRSEANIMANNIRGPQSPLGKRREPKEMGRGR